jgi:hypothetical protein
MSILSTLKRFGVICLILLAALACKKQQDEQPQHEPTEEELVKLHLEESFASFAAKLDLESSADAKEYIVKHSVVSLGLDRSVIYSLRQDSESLLWLRFRHVEGDNWLMEGDMYGGLEFRGSLQPLSMVIAGPKNWEHYSDIHVYDNGKDVATFGVEIYDLGYIPVFRFKDGTSYSITTVLLVEPLIDYLLKHVLSTE